jgi:hypothetical protein
VFTRKPANLRSLIEDRRGKEGLAMLDENIALVKAVYAGTVSREELPNLLRLTPSALPQQKPARRR